MGIWLQFPSQDTVFRKMGFSANSVAAIDIVASYYIGLSDRIILSGVEQAL
jgi:hypothetical protein